jgi:hypothetical protein
MKKTFMPTSATGLTHAFAVALLFVSAACADAPDPISVSREPFASTAIAATQPHMLAGFFNTPQGNGAPCVPNEDASDAPIYIQSAEWLDEKGGQVVITGTDAADRPIAHMLVVPENAVTERTLFCMRLDPDNHMSVELLAHSVAADGSVVDLGKYGLQFPLRLYMAYSSAHIDTLDTRRVVIVSVPTAGPIVEQETEAIRFEGYAHARVQRLSKYALALD